ncbi:hypothetical protein [Variovorax sp. KK3]|uniref:hypothetical protein n=1 Tax=Variovorax sp. KK3 TaxID=1855728 RepID=UPI00097BBF71|nr:hypothetical protein [Variovorax sp. KK3]
MRVLGLLGVVLALVIVGLLVKKQLGMVAAPAAPAVAPGQPAAAQPRQAEQQFKQALDAAMQQPRPVPDEAR